MATNKRINRLDMNNESCLELHVVESYCHTHGHLCNYGCVFVHVSTCACYPQMWIYRLMCPHAYTHSSLFVYKCMQMYTSYFFLSFVFICKNYFIPTFFPNNNEKEKYYRKNVSEIQFARTVEIAMKLALIIIAYLTESTQREDTSTPFNFFFFFYSFKYNN